MISQMRIASGGRSLPDVEQNQCPVVIEPRMADTASRAGGAKNEVPA